MRKVFLKSFVYPLLSFIRYGVPSRSATTLVAVGRQWYAADIFSTRSPCDVLPNLAGWFEEFKQKVEHWMTKPTNRFTDVRLYIDEHGSSMVFAFDRDMTLGNAKSAIGTLQRAIPAETLLGKPAQLIATLHPFDELDKERLEAMQPITGFRPPNMPRALRSPRYETHQFPGTSGAGSRDFKFKWQNRTARTAMRTWGLPRQPPWRYSRRWGP